MELLFARNELNEKPKKVQLDKIKEDLKILAALKIKVIRTYNVHLEEVSSILKVIKIYRWKI